MGVIPSPEDVCVHLPTIDGLRLRFLGSTLDIPFSGVPDPGDLVAKLLGVANTALMPLMPVLDVIDALFAIVKVFEAVKSLNPAKIGAALVELVKIVDKLRSLLPPVWGPAFAKDVVRALRLALTALRDQIEQILRAQTKINAARGVAAPEAIACAEENLAATFAALSVSAAPVNRIIRVVNIVLALAGLDPLPALDLGADAESSVAPLSAAIATLATIEAAIPA